MSVEALFEQLDETRWRGTSLAMGVFEGLQGGAVAGFLCTIAEAQIDPGFVARSAYTNFLRPCPAAAFSVDSRVLHSARRAALVEASLLDGERLCARILVTAVTRIEGLTVPEPVVSLAAPEMMAINPDGPGFVRPRLMDAMEARRGDDGRDWFRLLAPITGAESAFARALPAIDWIGGLSRPDLGGEPAVRACPNVDLAVHLDRAPEGDWIGLRANGAWRGEGVGRASSPVFDRVGEIGQASSTHVLVP